MSNMQDRVLQLIQLIQFRVDTGWSVTVTNNFIGNDVKISSTSLAGFEMMGFNVKSFTQDSKQEKYYFTTDQPIPFPDCSYQYQWAKYGRTVIPPNMNLHGLEKGPLNGAHRTMLCEFLKIDIAGNLSSSLSPCLIRYWQAIFFAIQWISWVREAFKTFWKNVERSEETSRKSIMGYIHSWNKTSSIYFP